ncbi:helicase [Aureococcus anophagefferens]|nr:helicase [Aureococcus anophagefferens]
MFAIFAALLCGAAALQPTWQSLNLPPPIVQALTSTDDYATPTAVQAETIPVALDGHDCLIHAQTGSGKTLAYLAPLFARVDASRQTTQAVVIVPTRELGLQVAASRGASSALGGARRQAPAHLAERLASMRWSKKAPSYVRVGAAEATPGSLSHFSAVVPDKGANFAVLRKMLRDVKRSSTRFAAIVFFDERRPLQAIADKLEQADGVACAVLDGATT